MQDKLSLYSMTPRPSGSQPQSSIKPNMAYTWSKSLGEASTDVHATTSANVIQMLSSEEPQLHQVRRSTRSTRGMQPTRYGSVVSHQVNVLKEPGKKVEFVYWV